MSYASWRALRGKSRQRRTTAVFGEQLHKNSHKISQQKSAKSCSDSDEKSECWGTVSVQISPLYSRGDGVDEQVRELRQVNPHQPNLGFCGDRKARIVARGNQPVSYPSFSSDASRNKWPQSSSSPEPHGHLKPSSYPRARERGQSHGSIISKICAAAWLGSHRMAEEAEAERCPQADRYTVAQSCIRPRVG